MKGMNFMKAIIEENSIKFLEKIQGLVPTSQPIECEISIRENILEIKLPKKVVSGKTPLEKMIEDIKNATTACDVGLLQEALEVEDA